MLHFLPVAHELDAGVVGPLSSLLCPSKKLQGASLNSELPCYNARLPKPME